MATRAYLTTIYKLSKTIPAPQIVLLKSSLDLGSPTHKNTPLFISFVFPIHPLLNNLSHYKQYDS